MRCRYGASVNIGEHVSKSMHISSAFLKASLDDGHTIYGESIPIAPLHAEAETQIWQASTLGLEAAPTRIPPNWKLFNRI